MDIQTIIREGKVVHCTVRGVDFPIKVEGGIDMTKFGELTKTFEVLDKYVDIPNIGMEEGVGEEWTEEELGEFMTGNNDTQTALFKILLSEGSLLRQEFVKKLAEELGRKVSGWTLGGALAGINNRAKNTWGKQLLIEAEWKRLNGKDWGCFYTLVPKYKDMIRRCLK